MNTIQLITKLNNEGETVVYDCCYGNGTEVLKIPQGVKHIACSFYSAKPTLKAVFLPKGLKTIGRFAFSETKLTEINFPSTLEQIGDNAFAECKKLCEIIFPESVTAIGNEAFKLCVGLNNVVLNARLHSIGMNAFSQSGIERIVLPKSLKGFYYAFSSCEKLKEVFAERGLEKIDNGAFANCTSLVSIVIPEGLTEICKEAFDGCISLKKIVLPSTLKKIDDGAFANCTSLKEVVLPSAIEKISDGAFYRCENLESINIPKGATVAENAFNKCYKLPSLPSIIMREYKTEADGVEFIFSEKDGKAYLKNVSGNCLHKMVFVPNGVYGVAERAFAGTQFDGIVLPEDVQEVGTEAFKNCENLLVVYIPKSVQTVQKDAFADCKNLTIYCGGKPQKGWLDEPEQTVQEEVEVPDGWNDYQHNKMNSHWEKVTSVIQNCYNPENRPVYTNVSREEFLKTLK